MAAETQRQPARGQHLLHERTQIGDKTVVTHYQLIELAAGGDVLIFKTMGLTGLNRAKRGLDNLFINGGDLFTRTREKARQHGKTVGDARGAGILAMTPTEPTTREQIMSVIAEMRKLYVYGTLGIGAFEWLRHTNGNAAASWGLRLRPRDMAKLGQLVLAQGRWGEQPIVSAAWVRASLAPHIAGEHLYYYGSQWWLGRSLVHQQDLGWAAAVGLGGQRIVIVPALDLAVVVTAGMYQSPLQVQVPLGILQRVLHAVH